MPMITDSVDIASIPPTHQVYRSPFWKHVFVGGNVYMLRMLKDNIQPLGLTASAENFDSTIVRAEENLTKKILIYFKGKIGVTTNNHQKVMTEIRMRSFIDGRSVEQSHRFVLRAIFWQIFLLSRSSTFPEFLLTLTVLASHRRELRPFQTRLPKVCF